MLSRRNLTFYYRCTLAGNRMPCKLLLEEKEEAGWVPIERHLTRFAERSSL